MESHFNELLCSISKGHSGRQHILAGRSLKFNHAKTSPIIQVSTQPSMPAQGVPLNLVSPAGVLDPKSREHEALHGAALKAHSVLAHRPLRGTPQQHKLIFRVWKTPLTAFRQHPSDRLQCFTNQSFTCVCSSLLPCRQAHQTCSGSASQHRPFWLSSFGNTGAHHVLSKCLHQVEASELSGIFISLMRVLWQGTFFESKTYFAN